jgi:hypothetical protein
MLDGLANGPYALHLSGRLGLTDFAGNPLRGNDASGDFVVPFTVGGPARGVNGDPLVWANEDGNDDLPSAQDLGLFFPHELQAGVAVTRDATPGAADTADCFRFQVLQGRVYTFTLDTPAGATLTLSYPDGTPVDFSGTDTGDGIQAQLDPGDYVVTVSGWGPGQAGSVAYQLRLGLGESNDNPPPLTLGPRPASMTYLVDAKAPAVEVSAVPPLLTPPLQVAESARLSDAVAAALTLLIASPISFECGGSASGAAPAVNPVGPPAPPRLPSNLLAGLGAGPVGGVEEGDAKSPPAVARADDEAAKPANEPAPAAPPRTEPAPPRLDWFARLWEAWANQDAPVAEAPVNLVAAATVASPAPADTPAKADDIQAAAFGSNVDLRIWAPALVAASAALAAWRVRRGAPPEDEEPPGLRGESG